MNLAGIGTRLKSVIAGATAVGSLLLLSTSGAPAAADGQGHGRSYLALGDSVVFGYITQAGFEYGNPTNFVGYPQYAGANLGLDVANAACPGETSGSLLSSTAVDNGCRAFRSQAPLHVFYAGTQIDDATGYLRHHPDTRLVTLGIGANDGFVLEASCATSPNPQACIGAGLPALLATLGHNLDATYKAIHEAGFHGVLMAVNYYSLNYNDPAGTGLTKLLNETIAQHTLAAGGVVADVFSAFQTAASTAFAQGDSCRAGLLNAAPSNQFTCDVHPSQSGQQLLARTVEASYRVAVAGH